MSIPKLKAGADGAGKGGLSYHGLLFGPLDFFETSPRGLRMLVTKMFLVMFKVDV